MVCERIDVAEWPAVISQGPGYYGLRLPQEYGTIVEYVGPRWVRTETRYFKAHPTPVHAWSALRGASMTIWYLRGHGLLDWVFHDYDCGCWTCIEFDQDANVDALGAER